MSTIILLGVALTLLLISFFKNRKKTKKSIIVAKKMFTETVLNVTGLLLFISLILALIPDELIKNLLGNSSMLLSGVFGAMIGTVTIIPAFVAFPLANSMMESGANLVAIAAFITTLTMVGFVTLPIEIEHFGKKFAFYRNGLSFILALFVAFGMVIIL